MAEREREQEERDDEAVLIALVLLLLAGLPFPVLAARIIRLLATVGIVATAAAAVLALIGTGGLVFTAGRGPEDGGTMGPAEATMRRSEVTRRARYILAASRRLQAGGSPKAEQALYQAHLAAEHGRIEGAREIDKAAAKWGPVLGWHSVRDGRTTKECMSSHGSNFSALRPPAIGWPGTLHGGNCRCRAVAPWPGGDLLP